MRNSIIPNLPSIECGLSMSNTSPNKDNAEDRNVRARQAYDYGLVPYDQSFRITQNVVEICIDDLMKDHPERKRAIMYLQLIRFVSGNHPTNTPNGTSYRSYYKKGNEKNNNNLSRYYRLPLLRDMESNEGNTGAEIYPITHVSGV